VETWRKLALGVLLVGLIGTGTELYLLGHYEDRFQWAPLLSLAVGVILTAAVAVRPTARLVKVLRVIMALYVPVAVFGLYLHITSNVEFEVEMRPSIDGFELIRESLTGAIPALAPGAMLQLGLIGLLACFRHPMVRLTQSDVGSSSEEEESS
jgi:hypothetical protein